LTETEIIEKLKPKLREEGLEVDFLGREGAVVNIRARRVSPGVPVAFLVKAIAGTYRRYIPEIEDVCLAEYDPGEAIGTAPSETFEPVFKHKSVFSGLELKGLPVIDLAGLDRRHAIQALENFARAWSSKSPILGVEGLEEDAPMRAMKKWAAVYQDDYSETQVVSERRWNILVAPASSPEIEEMLSKPDERMPGKIFLMLVEDSE